MKNDICLIELPFSQYAMPVYSLSLLKGCLNKAGLSSRVIYGNMRFSKITGVEEYLRPLTLIPIKLAMGDAVFSEAAHNTPDVRERYREMIFSEKQFSNAYKQYCYETFELLAEKAINFIEEFGNEILKEEPKIVGMSSVFFQNNACIALAKYIKAKNPEIITMIGGANCIGETAWGMVKYNSCIDYAFSGEADECFADFCKLLLAEGNLSVDKIPYGILRADMNIDERNIPIRRTAILDDMPYPDFDDWFDELDRLDLAKVVSPSLLAEFSRGCWWNDKKPCTFCGLNNGNHHYRTKSAERIIDELRYLKEKYGHRTQRIMLTDNILSQYHVKELLPQLIEKPSGMAVLCEVKSNMTQEEVRLFKKAGFSMLQPGIESLQDDVLKLMNKGNRAIKHIELLKNFAIEGIRTVWNFLVGFPGEKPEYYAEIAEMVPLITHLQGPLHFVPIMYNRGSEYLLHPERYNLEFRPNRFYEITYPDEAFRKSVAILYEITDEKRREKAENFSLMSLEHIKAAKAVGEWIISSNSSAPDKLIFSEKAESLEIYDLRKAAVKTIIILTKIEREVALLAQQVIKKSELIKRLADKYSSGETEGAIEKLRTLKLVLEIRDELLFLPLPEKTEKKMAGDLSYSGYFLKMPHLPAAIMIRDGEQRWT